MIRPGSGERFLRLIGAIAGDFCVAWATLAMAIYLRRTVPMPFTRSLLPPDRLPLDAPIVLLFGAAFVAALGLAGFYRLRVLPRARPIRWWRSGRRCSSSPCPGPSCWPFHSWRG